MGWASRLRAAFVVTAAFAACAPRAPASPRGSAQDADAGVDAPTAALEDGDAGAEDHDGDAEADDVASPTPPTPAGDPRCPEGMVVVETAERAFCIDRFEASLVETLPDGSEQPYPHYKPVDGHVVRAVSLPEVFPQGFISEVQAEDACSASGKRLCRHAEWKTACMGPSKTTFPYGDARQAGTCHDQGRSAVLAVFGAKAVMASTPYAAAAPAAPTKLGIAPSPVTTKASTKPGSKKPAHVTTGRAAQTVKTRPSKTATGKASATKATKPTKATKKRIAGKASARPSNVDPGVWAKLNEPALGQVEGALAKTGAHPGCVNGFGVVDMVGNLHEWVATDASLPHGTFAGGYYLDTSLNGDGCHYKTVAHAHDYHDYSTGFRCCADLAAP